MSSEIGSRSDANVAEVPFLLAEQGDALSALGELVDMDDVVTTTAKILIADGDPMNHKLVEWYLYKAGYRYFVMVNDAHRIMGKIRQERPDLILLDITMPGIDGVGVLEKLRRDKQLRETPVIVLNAASNQEMKKTALGLRVSDFLDKPVDPYDLIARVRNALIVKAHRDHLENYANELEETVRQRTAELAASRQEVILCLARAAELRDNETGNHVVRVGRYVGIIARELGFSDERVDLLEHAAQLHDVGKIGIPDSILLKPGKLEPEEFEKMQKHASFGRKVIQRLSEPEFDAWKKHAQIGAEMLDVVRSPIIELAASIALTHHEKWDGSGYPLGLAGEDIPMEGRMTAVADVFDALSTKRPYKPAFPHKKCFEIMEEGRAQHFDPRVLDAFFRRRAEIAKVQIECADVD